MLQKYTIAKLKLKVSKEKTIGMKNTDAHAGSKVRKWIFKSKSDRFSERVTKTMFWTGKLREVSYKKELVITHEVEFRDGWDMPVKAPSVLVNNK